MVVTALIRAPSAWQVSYRSTASVELTVTAPVEMRLPAHYVPTTDSTTPVLPVGTSIMLSAKRTMTFKVPPTMERMRSYHRLLWELVSPAFSHPGAHPGMVSGSPYSAAVCVT